MRRRPIVLIAAAIVTTVMLVLVVALDVRFPGGSDDVSHAVAVARERLTAVTAEIAAELRTRADEVGRAADGPLAEMQSIVVHVVAKHSGVSHVDFDGAAPQDRRVDVALVVSQEYERDFAGQSYTMRVGSCVRFTLDGLGGIDCEVGVWDGLPPKVERPQFLVPGGVG